MRTLFALLFTALLTVGASAQTWSSAPPMQTARTGAASAVLDGRLYVMGGSDAAGVPLATAEVFDPAVGWSPIRDLPSPRTDAAAAVLDGQVVLIGGRGIDDEPTDAVEAYDPAQDQWVPIDSLEVAREGLGAVAVNDVLYAFGGAGSSGVLLGTAETYTSEWTSYALWSLLPPRAQFGSVAMDSSIVVVGGFSTLGPLRSVQRFVPADGTTFQLDSLQIARGGVAAATDGRSIFAIGGRDAFDAILSDVDVLAPGRTWESLTALPEPRESVIAAVLGDQLYVIGGTDEFGSVLATAWKTPVEQSVDTPVVPDPDVAARSLVVTGANPSRHGTAFEVRTGSRGTARLTVVDVLGREVAVLLDRTVGPEPVRLVWAADVPAGLYVARLSGPGGVATAAVTVVR